MRRLLILVAITTFIGGCTIHQYIYKPDELRYAVTDRLSETELARLEIPYSATPEMIEFARDAVDGEINPIDKSIEIVKAIMSRWVLDVQYERQADFTAPEVFHHTRRANCLSFTHLFVSLARAMDIRAH
ncbi:MAG TPA: transglutaminase family protein [bacterium]|nr:transglutaminase family protein [bacterium]